MTSLATSPLVQRPYECWLFAACLAEDLPYLALSDDYQSRYGWSFGYGASRGWDPEPRFLRTYPQLAHHRRDSVRARGIVCTGTRADTASVVFVAPSGQRWGHAFVVYDNGDVLDPSHGVRESMWSAMARWAATTVEIWFGGEHCAWTRE